MKKIDLHYFGFFLIIFFIFLGAFSPFFIYVSFLFVLILSINLGEYFLKNPSAYACLGILNLLVFQNLAIGLGAHLVENSSESLKYLTQIPFFSIALIWIILQKKYFLKGKILLNKVRKSFLGLIICVAFSLIIGHGSLQSILMNLRNLTVFFMAYEIGKHNLYSKDEIDKFINKVLKISRIVLIAGILLMIFGYKAYELIGVKEVYLAKGAPLLVDKLDGRFYTTLIKNEYLRMGSIYYEPVNLAYFYSATLIISLFYKNFQNSKIKIFNILINGLGLLLTFGKGGYLIVIALILLVYGEKILKKILSKISKKTIYKITILIGIAAIVTFCIYYYKNIGAAASPHFWGVIRTWQSVIKKPIGYGLGTGGNMAQIFNENANKEAWFNTGGETALMSFMYQIGVQGILFLFLCFKNMSDNVEKNDKFKEIFKFIPYVLIGISLLQDNTYTPQCIVLYMFMQGASQITEINLRSKNEKRD